jgi:hypothetical protein
MENSDILKLVVGSSGWVGLVVAVIKAWAKMKGDIAAAHVKIRELEKRVSNRC